MQDKHKLKVKNNTCRLRVTAFGWHLEQIPRGHGGWSLQPSLILQLISSKATNLPLKIKRYKQLSVIYK